MDIQKVLQGVPLFSDALTQDQLGDLAARAGTVEFEPGSAIFHEHEPGTTMYVIVDGSVVITIDDGAGKRSVATLTQGSIFGEISWLTGLPRLRTVTADGKVEAIEITKAMLEPILAGAPKLYDRLATLLQKRQSDLDQIVDPGYWNKVERSRENLSKVMRRHFGEAQ